MSTDRLAGETTPEQEAAPGATDAQSPDDSPRARGDEAAGADAASHGSEETAPAAEPEPDTGSGPETAPEAAAPDAAAGDPAEAAVAPGSAAATAAALAAAVRAVESGERSAASFFTQTQRAPKPATPAASGQQAGTPAADARPAQAGGPAGPAPQQAAGPAGAPAGPVRPPVADGGAGDHGGTPAPDHAAPTPRPTVATAPGLAGVRQVLAAGGAPAELADKAAETLGERAAEALNDDPWQLLAVPGVRPEQADGFARALLGAACRPDDERRAQALVLWLLEQAAVAGHSALEAPALRAALAQRSVPDPDEALQTAIADGAVLVFQDAIDTPGRPRPAADDDEEQQPVRVLLGLDRFAMAEESVADGLARLLNTFEPAPESEGPAADESDTGAQDASTAVAADDAEGSPAATAEEPRGDSPAPGEEEEPEGIRRAHPSAAAWEAAAAAAPSPSAAELIRAAAHSGLVAHTGAEAARAEPAALIAAARALGLRAFGATHSENGRRRLAAQLSQAPQGTAPTALEGADTAAVTVSGLLSGQQGPGRDADGALALDLLVVLDAPQLDLETAALLIESLTDGTRLVLSGDPGVLWSAGPGRLFTDLLAAHCCPQVASRTPDFGPIGELVSGIGIGELNQVEAPGKEVVIVPARDAGEAVHRTVQLVADSVPRALGVPADQTQVITVGHGGAAGTRALNTALKERLNPGPGRFGGFDPGDRVAYAPAPGRTVPGTVTGADADGLHLDCGAPVVVPREQVGSGAVRHGWALTAHQAAGMRWPAVVAVLPGDAAGGLTRAWAYTAFSRGERHLSVVQGVDQALARAVAEVPVKERTTRLRTLLQMQTVQAAADAAAG
ncbi:helix-hairpin-helix domain-containing protein [Streptomyces sp. NPDC017993]|uniref:helix-hairpin-helix domain-containing protein n=1 Tax=Streptomyces sp. NPDC017993 TaxID=3365027 RepID=UPI00378C10AA